MEKETFFVKKLGGKVILISPGHAHEENIVRLNRGQYTGIRKCRVKRPKKSHQEDDMTEWLLEKAITLSDILGEISFVIITVSIIILVPLSFFKKTRYISSSGLYLIRVMGFSLWCGYGLL